MLDGMPITLRPEHEKLVAAALQTGAYRDPDEVIERALEMLQSSEEWLRGNQSEIEGRIERAFLQFDEGKFYSAEDSRADMKRRKAVWRATQQQ